MLFLMLFLVLFFILLCFVFFRLLVLVMYVLLVLVMLLYYLFEALFEILWESQLIKDEFVVLSVIEEDLVLNGVLGQDKVLTSHFLCNPFVLLEGILKIRILTVQSILKDPFPKFLLDITIILKLHPLHIKLIMKHFLNNMFQEFEVIYSDLMDLLGYLLQ